MGSILSYQGNIYLKQYIFSILPVFGVTSIESIGRVVKRNFTKMMEILKSVVSSPYKLGNNVKNIEKILKIVIRSNAQAIGTGARRP